MPFLFLPCVQIDARLAHTRLVRTQITWAIYLGGLVFLPRQIKQERRRRAPKDTDSNEGKAPIAAREASA